MGLVAKCATRPILFAIAALTTHPYLELNGKRLSKSTLTGRHSPPLSLAPGQYYGPHALRGGRFFFTCKSCSPFCPPRTGSSVDNSAFMALRDSKSMRPSSHQARMLRCKEGPETDRQSGKEGMQDRQFCGQTSRKTWSVGRGGGYEENEYQVRLIAREATPGRIPKVPR